MGSCFVREAAVLVGAHEHLMEEPDLSVLFVLRFFFCLRLGYWLCRLLGWSWSFGIGCHVANNAE